MSFDLIPRTIASLSITPAKSGMYWQISMPGTFVAIGVNSPRISAGASGFISKLSMCDGPPRIQIMMTDLFRQEVNFEPVAALACRRSTSASESPASESAPTRNTSRRETAVRHFRSGPEQLHMADLHYGK